MLKLTHIAVVALLAIGAAAVAAPTFAQQNPCTSNTCPPPGTGAPPVGDTEPPPGTGTPPFGGQVPPPGNDNDDEDDTATGWPVVPVPTSSSTSTSGANSPLDPALGLGCAIKGKAGTSSDLWLINTGNVELPSGLKIRYSIPATGDRGAFLLPRTLDAGEEGRLTDFISAAVDVGEKCTVQIVG